MGTISNSIDISPWQEGHGSKESVRTGVLGDMNISDAIFHPISCPQLVTPLTLAQVLLDRRVAWWVCAPYSGSDWKLMSKISHNTYLKLKQVDRGVTLKGIIRLTSA